jgi:hypothetical protein
VALPKFERPYDVGMERAGLWDEDASGDADKARELINLHNDLMALQQAAVQLRREAEEAAAEQAPLEIVAAHRILALEAEALVRDAEGRYREAATQFQDIMERYRRD